MLVISLSLMLLCSRVNAAPAPAPSAPPTPAPCAAIAGFHILDFWLGEWDVYTGNDRAGHDSVTALHAGCAVREEWVDMQGSPGTSLFTYNNFIDQWQQVWVTDRATARGGLKFKTLVARYPDGGVRFQGLLPGAAGSRLVLDRTTLTPLAPGRVHQVIEYSLDGGTTWTTSFNAIYVRPGKAP